MFSTSPHYLPIPPPGVASNLLNAGLSTFQIDQVILPETFSLFDGPDAVHKHFNLNTSASNLLNNKVLKAKADDFAKVQGVVNRITEKSLFEQQIRMDYEEENGFVTSRLPSLSQKVTDTMIYKETKAKMHRELTSLSTKQVGFMMYLNHNQPNLPSIETIIPQSFNPQIIIQKLLLKNGGGNNVDEADENDVEDDDKKATVVDAKNILYSGALEIVKTAKSVLSEIDSGKLVVRDPIGVIDFDWFASMHITTTEKVYYEARDTVMKVLKIVATHYDSAAAWEPFPLQAFSIEDQRRMEKTRILHQQQIIHASTISGSFLVPNGHGLDSTKEFVERAWSRTEYFERCKIKKSRYC